MITCFFENNDKVNLRHVTVGAIVVKGGKVLLGKRGTFKGKPILESGKWSLIGGFMERNESTTEAIRREVMEESGLTLKNIQLLRINDNPNRPKEDRQNVDFIFFGEADKQTETSDEEVKELKWFSLDELPEKVSLAFDHGDDLELYIKYLKEKFVLPVLG